MLGLPICKMRTNQMVELFVNFICGDEYSIQGGLTLRYWVGTPVDEKTIITSLNTS